MEYSLASYAVSPADAEDFQLSRYATHTLQHQEEQRQKRGALLDVSLDDVDVNSDAVFVDDDGTEYK